MSDIAKRDGNYIPAIQGVSSVDGSSLVDIHVDPSTHKLLVESESGSSQMIATYINDGTSGTANVRMDGKSNFLAIVDHTEFAVHNGKQYYMEGYVELDDGDTFYVKLVTPNTTTWGHFQWIISASGIVTTHLYEGASGGMTGGTPVTPLNSNRNSSNTSTMVITKGVTAPTSTGTTISTAKMGSSSGGWSPVINGGSTSSEHEIIMKQNTTYCRKFLSGTDSNVIYFKVLWGEGAFIR